MKSQRIAANVAAAASSKAASDGISQPMTAEFEREFNAQAEGAAGAKGKNVSMIDAMTRVGPNYHTIPTTYAFVGGERPNPVYYASPDRRSVASDVPAEADDTDALGEDGSEMKQGEESLLDIRRMSPSGPTPRLGELSTPESGKGKRGRHKLSGDAARVLLSMPVRELQQMSAQQVSAPLLLRPLSRC